MTCLTHAAAVILTCWDIGLSICLSVHTYIHIVHFQWFQSLFFQKLICIWKVFVCQFKKKKKTYILCKKPLSRPKKKNPQWRLLGFACKRRNKCDSQRVRLKRGKWCLWRVFKGVLRLGSIQLYCAREQLSPLPRWPSFTATFCASFYVEDKLPHFDDDCFYILKSCNTVN